MSIRPICLFAIVSLLAISDHASPAAEWTVPMAGNAYATAPSPSGRGFQRDGSIQWANPEAVYSAFFHVSETASLNLKIRASGADGRALLRATVAGESFDVVIEGPGERIYELGEIKVPAGYVRIDLQGIERKGARFPSVRELVVSSDQADLQLDYVKSNKGNMFYWGRRGPSVHLKYETPKDLELQYAYSEITVPVGQDPIGTFYMANGFAQGYFGFQVNGPEERRVLFSVWSPFRTDNPREIPEDQRVIALARGRDVRTGEFGNEGSGGQSFLVYPWKAGTTYRFLTELRPDGEGNTIYTSWFGEKSAEEWRLIASFRRPKTDTFLRGFHSFLESFNPTLGHVGRRSHHGNAWVCDKDGQWHECTRARFTVDTTGGGRHRLDFAGGSDGTSFMLRNCGFFNGGGKAGRILTRESSAAEKPKIDFEALPRK